MPGNRIRLREKGFTLLTTGVLLIAFIGACGFAIDAGRMYIAKDEVQTFADSAALGASLELDGSLTGLENARKAVGNNPNKWNFASTSYGNAPQVLFSQNRTGPWESNPASAAGILFARVVTRVNVPLSLMSVINHAATAPVAAAATAGQVEQTTFKEGLFPFSPFAHSPGSPPDFGLVPGNEYTLRWPSNVQQPNQLNVCRDDRHSTAIAMAENSASSVRGFYGDPDSTNTGSASIERAIIVDDKMFYPVTVGEPVWMTGGADATMRDGVITRIQQDTDPVSPDYAHYKTNVDANGNRIGNGRRIVGAPINAGPGWSPPYQVVGIAGFFLLPANQQGVGGNQSLCAEYIGAWVLGSNNKGAGEAGAYIVRLVE